jgi:hypothetical protein
MKTFATVLSLLFASSGLAQAADLYSAMFDKKENFGSVLAPAALPSGASAVYGYAGVPELGAGYRLGVSGLELDGRVKVNYLLIAVSLEAVAKFALLQGEKFQLAPFLGPGLVFNTGARYFDLNNFRSLALRILGGVTVTYRLGDIWRVIGQVDVPLDISLSPGAAGRWSALGGGGFEIYLGEDFSALVLGQLGIATAKDQLATQVVQLGYSLRLGLGLRLY